MRAAELALPPLFIPSEDCNTYEGFIVTSGAGSSGQPHITAVPRPGHPASSHQPQQQFLWLRISNVRPPGSGGLRHASIECGADLQKLLAGQEHLIAQRLAVSPSLPVFLSELQELVDRGVQHRLQSAPPEVAFYEQLVRELDDIGWHRVTWMSQDCTAVVLEVPDEAGRDHTLKLDLPTDYPINSPTVTTDLPQPLKLQWANPVGSSAANAGQLDGRCGLRSVLHQFQEALHHYQDLWACLDDFDDHSWVLEPALQQRQPQQQPRAAADQQAAGSSRRGPRGGTYRRLALGGHCSVALKLDPRAPRRPPLEVRFMGAPSVVDPLQQRYFGGLHIWSEARMPRENLEALLGMSLPQREQGDAEDLSADCAVCYAYFLKDPHQQQQQGEQGTGVAPDVICPTPACGRPYHRACLVEWLRALEDTTCSFGTLFGKCPYCFEVISVKAD